jgi:hypothetical protein
LVNEYDGKIGYNVNHISFTTANLEYNDIRYEDETYYYETVELLNRIRFILTDLVSKNEIDNYFCIGGTDLEKKNSIYRNFLKAVVGEGGFEKMDTDLYTTGWGLFFKI